MNFISGNKIEHENAVEEVLLANYDWYYRLAYSYVRSEADAFDIVQNGAYQAIRNSGKLRQPQYAATWVYRIMLNEIFRFCGAKENKFLPLNEEVLEQGKEDVYEDVDLRRALERLSPQDKAIVELRFFEDMKIEEVAEVLGENVSTIKSRLYRSMKKLKLYVE